MVFSSVLMTALLVALLYGRVPGVLVFTLCAGLLPLLWLLCRSHQHSHTGLLQLDRLAQSSRLAGWNTGLKVCGCVALLVFCVAANSFWVAAVVLALATGISLATSRVGLVGYLSLLAVPMAFVALSGLVLLVDVSPVPLGLLDIRFFGRYLCVTPATQSTAALVLAKALAAVSCLYMLSLSTPVYEITAFLRWAHVPAIVVELMVLIYRYIFVLLSALHAMQTAAAARLGYRTYRSAWRSFGGIGANLLVRSFVRASRSFDAMEARGYTGEIRFLQPAKPLRAMQLAAVLCVAALPTATLLLERGLA